jgi:uncharacterized protein YxjI
MIAHNAKTENCKLKSASMMKQKAYLNSSPFLFVTHAHTRTHTHTLKSLETHGNILTINYDFHTCSSVKLAMTANVTKRNTYTLRGV